MECCCENMKIYELKLEADVDTDPVWCNRCGCNLELDELPISLEQKEKLRDWAVQYGEWIDWDNDKLCENGLELEKEHNQMGQSLSSKIQKEVGDSYRVSFSPSRSARHYLNND
ncbi:hypothetical protein ABE65_012775 [Fictibacillus phosphorivorans]|uniref:Uncharacterized protein n=1 Tax=Fictibacillus phosphorivorans TaxID=1221500 RepID=A0A160IPL5_9BACL|nr:hypothetical protein [Fictibacillus phosphorivorans]ANC77622.1 hypothetical protein ABE65_012775 [Fictibacillus phosphorivorans]